MVELELSQNKYNWTMEQKDGYAEVYIHELNYFYDAMEYVNTEGIRIIPGLDAFYIPTEIREISIPYKRIQILFATSKYDGYGEQAILYTILVETVKP